MTETELRAIEQRLFALLNDNGTSDELKDFAVHSLFRALGELRRVRAQPERTRIIAVEHAA